MIYDFRDKGGRTSITDLLYMVGGQFLNNMMARDAAARQYKYDERLAASAAERTAAEAQRGRDFEMAKLDKGYARQDDLIGRHDAYVRENPYAIPGTGGMMGTFLALGGKGDAAQYQPYLLPSQQQINTGDKIISRPLYPDGTGGEESSWNVGMSPKDAGDLDVKQGELALAQRAQADASARGWYSLNRPQPMQVMPDGRGGYVSFDPVSNKTYPIPGVVVPQADPNAFNREMIKLMIENWGKGDGGSGGRMGSFKTSGGSAMPGYLDTLMEKVVNEYRDSMFPGNPAKPNPQPALSQQKDKGAQVLSPRQRQAVEALVKEGYDRDSAIRSVKMRGAGL